MARKFVFDEAKHYISTPCKYGHDSIRSRKTGNCIQCTRVRIARKNHSVEGRTYQKNYRIQNKALIKKRNQIRNYGITYDQLLVEQNYCCAICNEKLDLARNTHIDHDYKTKQVRGILCQACNPALGLFKDDENRLRRAIEYLKKYK